MKVPTAKQQGKRKTSINTPKREPGASPASPSQPSNIPVQANHQQDVFDIYNKVRHHSTQLLGPDGEQRGIPASLHSFLLELLEAITRRKPVLILQGQAALSTIQASELLGVSRRFFVGLLEKGELPFHFVGTHRRVYARDLLHHKAQRDANGATIIRGLAQAEDDEGLYDRLPALEDDSSG